MGQEFTMAALITPTTVTGAVRRVLISTNDRLGFHLDTLGRFLGYVYDTNYRTITLASTATAGTSYHLCLTYKLNTLTFYIDGISQGTLAVTGPIVTATDVYIGNWSTLAQGFIGKIDEWEFSTTARDAAGVLELYKRVTIGNDAYADYCEAT